MKTKKYKGPWPPPYVPDWGAFADLSSALSDVGFESWASKVAVKIKKVKK
jgi:hypothetical protein